MRLFSELRLQASHVVLVPQAVLLDKLRRNAESGFIAERRLR